MSAVDVAALRQALQALVDRHAALRTGYPVVDGLPVQRIVGTASAVLELHQVEGIDETELRQHGRGGLPATVRSGQPARSSARPCIRASATDHVLLINVHHIAADGWSLLQLLDELRALYAESTGGPPASAARPDAEYTDFTAGRPRRSPAPRVSVSPTTGDANSRRRAPKSSCPRTDGARRGARPMVRPTPSSSRPN